MCSADDTENPVAIQVFRPKFVLMKRQRLTQLSYAIAVYTDIHIDDFFEECRFFNRYGDWLIQLVSILTHLLK